MPKRSVIGLALAGLALSAVPAYADAPITDGLICSFTTVIDPTAEEGTQTGQLEGGPVHFGEQADDGVTADQGTLVCRVQVVDAFTSDHNGTGPSVSGHTNAAGVATAGPLAINIQRTGTQNVFLCSEFVDDSDSTTYYWDDDNSEWSTSPLVHCGLSVTGDDGSPTYDDIINRLPCPIFGQLPDPLAQILQDTWEDCVQSVGSNVVVVVGTGTSGTLITPPGWSCSETPLTSVGSSGSVTCSPPGLNSTINCKEVFAGSVGITLPPPTTPSNISTTTSCGGGSFSVNATAQDDTTPIVALNWSIDGLASVPVTCEWDVSAGPVTAWLSVCSWNLPLPL